MLPRFAPVTRADVVGLVAREPGHRLGHYATRLGVETKVVDAHLSRATIAGEVARAGRRGCYVYGPAGQVPSASPVGPLVVELARIRAQIASLRVHEAAAMAALRAAGVEV